MSTAANDFSYEAPTVPDGALFVAADEPLLIFPSVRAAERWLEAIDVKNGVYPAAYGPKGEPFGIGCDRNRVVIARTGQPNSPDELKALILGYLEATGRPADASLNLNELVQTVWVRESTFWQEHDPYGDRFGTPVPLWGCAVLIALVGLGLFLALR